MPISTAAASAGQVLAHFKRNALIRAQIDRQDQSHGRENGEQRQFGKEHLAEIIEEADNETADQRALQTAQPADNDNDKSEQEHLEIGTRINPYDRPAHHTAESREKSS
jgi:hypothetical protein